MDKEEIMKYFMIISFLIFAVLVVQNASSNPIIGPAMNEVKINSNSFILEILDFGMMNLDGCFLTSRTDTAYFKPGIQGDVDYLLITQDSLLTPLEINPPGDELSFYGPGGFHVETIIFGDSSNCDIGVPLPNQSICLDDYGWPYYLDNTPTFGLPNDYSNAYGTLEGYVTNLAGDTLEGIKISRKGGSPVYTDEEGYFTFNELAIFEDLRIQTTPYSTGHLWVQVWPDSIHSINIIIENLVGIRNKQANYFANTFQLFQNYPNPLNPSTTISYQLPVDSEVELTIYNLLGQRIRTFNSKQLAGFHQVQWNGSDEKGMEIASGVYIYQLKSGEFVASKKMIFLK